MIGNTAAEPSDRLAWEIAAVAERLRVMSAARLRSEWGPYPSRAAAGLAVAQRLADTAAGVAGRGDPAPPEWREVPEIDAFAVGEQLAVTGHDLVLALAGDPTRPAAEPTSWLARTPTPRSEPEPAVTPRSEPEPAVTPRSEPEPAGTSDRGVGEPERALTPTSRSEPAPAMAGRLPRDAEIWTRTGRRQAGEVVDELVSLLRELRLGL